MALIISSPLRSKDMRLEPQLYYASWIFAREFTVNEKYLGPAAAAVLARPDLLVHWQNGVVGTSV
jgi:hypothetical protein